MPIIVVNMYRDDFLNIEDKLSIFIFSDILETILIATDIVKKGIIIYSVAKHIKLAINKSKGSTIPVDVIFPVAISIPKRNVDTICIIYPSIFTIFLNIVTISK